MPMLLRRPQPRQLHLSSTSTTVSARPAGTARARVLSFKAKDSAGQYMDLVRKGDTDKQIQDPFKGYYGSPVGVTYTPLEPPYNPTQLVTVGKQNSTLNQCIEAYCVNIEAYGYQLEYVGPPEQEHSTAAIGQKTVALSLFDNPSQAGDKGLREIRGESRKDMEYTGSRYFEIGQDMAGRPTFITNVPATTMRLTRKDTLPTVFEIPVSSPQTASIVNRKVSRYFRRYVQISPTGERVYFKEFGDPRSIDPKTGLENDNLAIEDQATAIYHQRVYCPGTEYGVPRWIGVLPSILGTRESELVNLNFFRENAIPAMAVLISGGALTEESFDNVSSLITSKRGKDAMNRILILEATADDSMTATDQAPHVPKIDMKPMVSERQTDGLFKDFEIEGKRKIRSAMRLPAIYAGDSEEYNRATAMTGQRIAESQVFYPERTFFDEFINMQIMPRLGISMWRFKTQGPTVYDPDSLSTVMDRFSRHGALTPNILVKIANQILDVQIHPIKDKWGDVPFPYVLAMVAAGREVAGFEGIFATINDATNPAVTPDSGETSEPADPNAGPVDIQSHQKARFRRQLRRELHKLSGDLVDQVNQAIDMRPAA